MNSTKKNSIFFIFIKAAATAILGLALLAGWSVWKSYKLESELIELRIKSQASRIDRTFSASIDTASYLLNLLTNQIRSNSDDKVYIQTLLKSFKNTNISPAMNNVLSFTTFSWINNQNEFVVNSEKGIIMPPKKVPPRDYIPAAMRNPGRIELGQPVIGAITSQWIIPAGMAATNDAGDYVGAVIIGLDISTFIKKLEKGISIPGVSFAIIDKDLNVIIESPDNKFAKTATLFKKLDTVSFAAVSSEPASLVTPMPFISNEQFTVVLKSKYPYMIVVSYDKALANLEYRKAIFSYLMEFAIITLVIFFLFFTIKRRIITPVIALSSVADQIAHGKENIDIPENTTYELHNLSMQLHSVIDYMKKLRSTQRSLEASVQEMENETEKAEAARAAAEIAREEAHYAMQSKALFLGKVVHEIQVPVNTVLDYADKQVKQLEANGIHNEYMRYGKKIAESARFIMLLVGDLLQRARSESDSVLLDERPLDLKEIIIYSMDMLQTRAAKHDVTITLQACEHLPRLFADDLRMKQILNNIISNAVKYTPTGGHVTIKTSIDDKDCIHIDVIDTGLGILPDEIDKITEDFYRINRHRETAEGTGLGLPLAKRLMELHGGKLIIQSTINIGTHVTLSFPDYRTVQNFMPFFSQAI